MQQQQAFHPYSVAFNVSQNQEAFSIKKNWRSQRSPVLNSRNVGIVREKKAAVISRYQEITNAGKRERKKPDSNVILINWFLLMSFFSNLFCWVGDGHVWFFWCFFFVWVFLFVCFGGGCLAWLLGFFLLYGFY